MVCEAKKKFGAITNHSCKWERHLKAIGFAFRAKALLDNHGITAGLSPWLFAMGSSWALAQKRLSKIGVHPPCKHHFGFF